VILGFINAEAAGVFAVVFDTLEEFRNELLAHSRKLGKLACLCCGFEAVYIANLTGGPDESDGFWAHARKTQQLEHGGFVFLEELFAKRNGAGGEEGLNVGNHTFADAGDSEQLFGIIGEGGQLGGLLLDSLGGSAVGADAEGVSCVNFEEGGGFVEQAGDRNIVHGDPVRARGQRRSLSQYATGESGTQGRVMHGLEELGWGEARERQNAS
jgi:hypothetical protein